MPGTVVAHSEKPPVHIPKLAVEGLNEKPQKQPEKKMPSKEERDKKHKEALARRDKEDHEATDKIANVEKDKKHKEAVERRDKEEHEAKDKAAKATQDKEKRLHDFQDKEDKEKKEKLAKKKEAEAKKQHDIKEKQHNEQKELHKQQDQMLAEQNARELQKQTDLKEKAKKSGALPAVSTTRRVSTMAKSGDEVLVVPATRRVSAAKPSDASKAHYAPVTTPVGASAHRASAAKAIDASAPHRPTDKPASKVFSNVGSSILADDAYPGKTSKAVPKQTQVAVKKDTLKPS